MNTFGGAPQALCAHDACDKAPTICRATDIPPELARLSAPPAARLSYNRCNLPAEALASLAFQLAPAELELDGVLPLHHALFEHLSVVGDATTRAQLFMQYMAAHFLLGDAAAQGLTEGARIDRSRLDYLRLLRGWLFDSEGREGAVLKGWVESRFGLLTGFHRAPLGDADCPARAAFERERAAGLYATGALEAQVDLLYAYAQYELARQPDARRHLTLYRGVSGRDTLAPLERLADGRLVVVLNNLSSFSASRERAGEFGDRVLECAVPAAKILAHSRLLPGRLQGEDEYLVIGGVAAVRRVD
ncbi:NAD(+)--dinitrogen-reductase ADP-D-ribosyltransferase [Pseudothauera nasutitermitis]|uniref:NAD(+)--dinitrogen-reductase ADP-D-ribosyltransferase n=1 Tax=Pseudothauera nasutitermitis TaxID=2565930 RepID=A0A4S4AZ88_9RHOO|nr:NAD(+)--dinitrogen-reductase ADP-D-ribosyltransferase [Pseudothauera nasutitermitis]THF64681.1 NAD(+)--dinitrogen-reductase ADP-D-ribosyltransferase [Pseudothauera nasutitermitis]